MFGIFAPETSVTFSIQNSPAYAHLAETDRKWTLSPALPETYEFLGDLYDEYLPNFRSRLFNANCNETFDLGLGRAAVMREQLGEGWADAARPHGASGLLVTDWGDFGHYNLQGNSWFGYA